MLKYTKKSVIAFDFKDALSFEGETGPYAQYAVVRAKNIFRKAGMEECPVPGTQYSEKNIGRFFQGENGDEFWDLWLTAAKVRYAVEQCIATTEPAYAAKYAFQLAQLFNNFYHRHHILTESDEEKKQFLFATVSVVVRALTQTLELMGIEVPMVM
jgi:arginyl-tRNA synthetase